MRKNPFQKNKYRNKPTYVNGVRFPSMLEANYYKKLVLRQQAGDIKYFLTQVPFRLPGNVKYVCDFMVVENDGSIKYLDTKGVQTTVFKMKKKQVEALYPVIIEIVTR